MATFVQKCKEECVCPSPLLSLLYCISPIGRGVCGVRCAVYRSSGYTTFTFHSSLLSTTLPMNDTLEYLLFTQQSSVQSNFLTDNLLENILRFECFVLVWSPDCWSHKTNLFSSDIGSDDDANPTNQSPEYIFTLYFILYSVLIAIIMSIQTIMSSLVYDIQVEGERSGSCLQ